MAKQLKTFQLKKRQAAELIKTVEQFTSEYTDDRVSEVSVCLDQLERYYEDFLQASAKVSELDEDGAETYVAERCEMDTRYRRVKGFLLRRQPSNPGVSDSVLIANSTMNTTGRSSAVNVRLPKIELPTFDGDSTKWLTFRDRFVAMIDSSADIPNIMKLQYLLSSLKGDAGLLFEHTTLTADNYDVTWTALLKRYDNPRTLVREYYRKIHHLPTVDVVIGGDTFWELHTGRKRSLGEGKPWLLETPFGWAISGNTSRCSGPNLRLCHLATNEGDIAASLQRFWEAESILEGPALSLEEDLCEKYYASTTTRNAQGRYVVSLPRNAKPEKVLGLSRDIADRRLLGVERRLKANPVMEKEYKRFMVEYEQLGHMVKLTEPVDDSEPHCYIPHHAVIKESSSSTKVRVVFDASCKTTSGYSLNDTLLIGPTVQDDLLTIILRFRKHSVALVADVEKMYRQILHYDKDRKLLRIRYRERSTEPIATYELQTVTYGTASAPFLATRTLQQIAHDNKQEYPKAVDPVLHDFYVDDLLTGAASVSEAIETRKQISSMLESAGFSLKKWASNIPAALDGVPSADLAIKSLLDWQEDQAVSILGLVWEPSNDMFRFRVDLPTPAEELTRCLVLSYTARIFDPLGLLGPTVILAKMFLQRLWGLKHEGKTLDWNRPLPAEIQEEWRRFHSTLYVLRELRVPRLVAHSNPERLQLHLFADASQGAYGACCYVRSDSTRGSTVRLLVAKSKVVSLSNTHSIARLELCAARLAVHLFQKVIRALNVSSSTVICWTDSMTVMHWLKSSPRRWKPFVANRVAQIQEETRISCWRHVPGSDNPADDISRGLRPEELLQCERWWQGPRWLSYGQEEWPVEPVLAKENEKDIEERLAVSKIVITSTTCDFSNTLFARYSSYGKLRRVVAYCLRILSNLRASKSTSINSVKRNTDMKTLLSSVPPLTAAELQDAELRLCQRAQHDSFAEEMDDLKRGKLVSGRSRLKWLSPYLDPKGVLRVGGRLGNANIPESTKHPIVLAASHRLSTLLVENTHHQKMHAGPQFMLATIRQKFWLIGGRNLAKSVYHRCHTCFRNKPTLVKQAVADLATGQGKAREQYTGEAR
ncbi:uncharacterized protein LOC118515238, partial [Anopheles stephensi]|uniref:uncharacterized protein LOC118515238 n=1 Tax=Anopheles stephensi TaxID=30069 RepID=UPI00165895C1